MLTTAAIATTAQAAGPPPGAGHGYNSIPSPLPGNLPSVGAEAYAFNEFGNEITLAGPATPYPTVTVTMSSWGCQSGSWYGGDCQTTPGATFSIPITLNIYNPPAAGAVIPGSLITSVTQTFSIPYRPSADNVNCTGAYAGRWYDQASNTCFNGLATNIRFHLDPHVRLSGAIVYGITYNTSHYGYNPLGTGPSCYATSAGCPWDSLNIALSQDPTNVTVGSDPNPGTVWQNSHIPGEYCDNGAAGLGFFRLDSPGASNNCWSVGPQPSPYYVPAVTFS